jgi:CheY-like chemotaxis protein
MSAVLLVEDDLPLREVMVDVLATEGIAAAVAGNGAEALSYLREAPRPQVILLDLMMPVMDGVSFRAEQRAAAHLRDIPVVLVSAERDLADKAWALQVDTYLHKPMELHEFLEVVRRYVR